MVDLNIDEMNLYDYVMNTYDRICDLTEGRRIALNYYLNNVNAKDVNVSLFKSVFGVSSFGEILELLTDMDRLRELHDFGILCHKESLKEESSIVLTGYSLKKVPRN